LTRHGLSRERRRGRKRPRERQLRIHRLAKRPVRLGQIHVAGSLFEQFEHQKKRDVGGRIVSLGLDAGRHAFHLESGECQAPGERDKLGNRMVAHGLKEDHGYP